MITLAPRERARKYAHILARARSCSRCYPPATASASALWEYLAVNLATLIPGGRAIAGHATPQWGTLCESPPAPSLEPIIHDGIATAGDLMLFGETLLRVHADKDYKKHPRELGRSAPGRPLVYRMLATAICWYGDTYAAGDELLLPLQRMRDVARTVFAQPGAVGKVYSTHATMAAAAAASSAAGDGEAASVLGRDEWVHRLLLRMSASVHAQFKADLRLDAVKIAGGAGATSSLVCAAFESYAKSTDDALRAQLAESRALNIELRRDLHALASTQAALQRQQELLLAALASGGVFPQSSGSDGGGRRGVGGVARCGDGGARAAAGTAPTRLALEDGSTATRPAAAPSARDGGASSCSGALAGAAAASDDAAADECAMLQPDAAAAAAAAVVESSAGAAAAHGHGGGGTAASAAPLAAQLGGFLASRQTTPYKLVYIHAGFAAVSAASIAPHGPLSSADASRLQRIRRLCGAVLSPDEERLVRGKHVPAAASAAEAVWRSILDRAPGAADHARANEREQVARVAEALVVARSRLLFDAHFKGGEGVAGGGSKNAPGASRGRWEVPPDGKAGSWPDELFKLCEAEPTMAGKATQLERPPSSLLQLRAEALRYLPTRLLRRHAAAAMAAHAGLTSDSVVGSAATASASGGGGGGGGGSAGGRVGTPAAAAAASTSGDIAAALSGLGTATSASASGGSSGGSGSGGGSGSAAPLAASAGVGSAAAAIVAAAASASTMHASQRAREQLLRPPRVNERDPPIFDALEEAALRAMTASTVAAAHEARAAAAAKASVAAAAAATAAAPPTESAAAPSARAAQLERDAAMASRAALEAHTASEAAAAAAKRASEAFVTAGGFRHPAAAAFFAATASGAAAASASEAAARLTRPARSRGAADTAAAAAAAAAVVQPFAAGAAAASAMSPAVSPGSRRRIADTVARLRASSPGMSAREAHTAAKEDRRADADADAAAFAAAAGHAQHKPELPHDLLPLPAMMPIPAIERVSGNGNTRRRKRQRTDGESAAVEDAAPAGGATDADETRGGGDDDDEEDEEEEGASARKLTPADCEGRRVGLVAFLDGQRKAISDARAAAVASASLNNAGGSDEVVAAPLVVGSQEVALLAGGKIFADLSQAQLREICKERRYSIRGTKDELISKLTGLSPTGRKHRAAEKGCSAAAAAMEEGDSDADADADADGGTNAATGTPVGTAASHKA